MKTEIAVTIMVPVEFDYEPEERQTFHNPGWPASATWYDFDHEEAIKRIEAELDKPGTEEAILEVVEQEIRDQAGEAAYEKWLARRESCTHSA